ncbi:MAG: SdpI family protein [Fimbriimonadaceae bacterium]|nr:SdpI family protein [Fimbriimonadaceae bacterium]QYK55479.1 MAG: SdpI family protein [Fimbriimonadaceae bacterium]
MRRRNAIFWALVTVAATLVYSAVVFPFLPGSVPVHWGLNGRPDQWWPKGAAIWIAPVFQFVSLVLLWRMPQLMPAARSTTQSERTSNWLFFLLAAFFGYLQIVTTQAALGPIQVTRWLMGAVFVLFGLMASRFSSLERNRWIGVRTRWSMSSDEAWRKTHAFAGVAYQFVSVVGLAMVLFDTPIWTWIAWFLGASLMVVAYSKRAASA